MLKRLVLAVSLACWSGGAAAAPNVREAGYDAILASRTDELLVYSYAGNSDVLVFDIPTLAQQGEMFNRVVALIERLGAPRARVLDNDELAEYIASVGRTSATFAFGNDFRSSELMVFFNLADNGRIDLNEQETLLRQFLLDHRLLTEKLGFLRVEGPDRVILSVPQQQLQPLADGHSLRITALARETILRHELSHGEYYTNSHYADYCRRFWGGTMSEAERGAFRKFLGGKSYDTGNEEMMINETQAYLMHTPDAGAFSPAKVGLSPAAIQALQAKFMAGNPPTGLFGEVRRTGSR